MGSGARPPETVDWLAARGETGGVVKCASIGPSRYRRLPRRAARLHVRPSRCWIAPRSPARGRAALSGCRRARWKNRGLQGPVDQARAPKAHRRSLWPLSKEFTPAMARPSSTSSPSRCPRPFHGGDRRRRLRPRASAWHPIGSHRASGPSARSSSAWVGRHRRRQQEQHQDHRRAEGTSTLQGYFVYDSKKSGSRRSRTCASAPSRSARLPGLSSGRASSAATSGGFARAHGRAGARREGRDAAARTPPTSPSRSGTSCPSGVRPASAPSISALLHRRGRGGRAKRAWAAASTPSCRRASSRSRASCRGMRRLR
jgi:hypothetical protein